MPSGGVFGLVRQSKSLNEKKGRQCFLSIFGGHHYGCCLVKGVNVVDVAAVGLVIITTSLT